ncbi:hypothetical protein KL946_004132 [Ogataea haglerorum]|uniref:Uncharacterized protein n=1 Tax=Ogataea haglerorum TaxID=1937702 RepID=A0ABQ7RCV6_9ASCO|nr:hypothetical protein KL946_004132 [Ogataea haglerorum]
MALSPHLLELPVGDLVVGVLDVLGLLLHHDVDVARVRVAAARAAEVDPVDLGVVWGELGSTSADQVPRQGKQLLHALERPARDLWQEVPAENEPQQTHAGEEVERSVVCHGQQHRRHSLGVAVLVGEVERHHDGGSQRPHAQRQHLGVEEVLHGVPAHGPADAVEVDRGERALAGAHLRRGEVDVLLGGLRHDRHVDGEVERRDQLDRDACVERLLPADEVDQEEGTEVGRGELDDAEERRHHHLVGLLGLADHGEQLGRVDRDGVRAAPLAEDLDHDAQRHSDADAFHRHERLDVGPQRRAADRVSFDLQLLVDVGDLRQDVGVVWLEVSELAEVDERLLHVALFDEPAGRLDAEEHGQNEDRAGQHDLQRGWVDPLVAARLVQRRAVVGEVGRHDAEIHRASEDVVARSSDRLRSALRDVAGSAHDGRTDAEPLDQTASVQLADRVARDLDDGGHGPHEAPHLQRSDSAERLGSVDGHQRPADRAQLDHRRDVRLEVGELRGGLVGVLEPKLLDKGGLGHRSGNVALVVAPGAAKNSKHKDRQKQGSVVYLWRGVVLVEGEPGGPPVF